MNRAMTSSGIPMSLNNTSGLNWLNGVNASLAVAEEVGF
jgi:hypothetical protein